MRQLSVGDLPELPESVVELIADGIYGLYTTVGRGSYVLAAGKDFYLLDGRGKVIAGPVGDFDELKVLDPVLVQRPNSALALPKPAKGGG